MIDWVHKESVTRANVCDTCGHQYSDVCGGCESLDGVPVKYKKKTNADRIRAMTDEELAEFFSKVFGCSRCPIYEECKNHAIGCYYKLFIWLKEECKE